MKYLAYLFGALAAAGAAVYLLIYLYRWEWQRAIICGILLLIVEVFLACVAMLSRLSRVERHLKAADARAADARRRLEQTRFEQGHVFRWLPADDGIHRTHVFVPILMVAGIAFSGLAWLVQKIASSSGRASAEQRLAGRIAGLAPPVIGADGVAPQLEDIAAVPSRRPGKRVLATIGAIVSAVLFFVLLGTLSDATKTRADRPTDSAATTVVFEIKTQYDSENTRRVSARNLWEGCSLSTAARLGHMRLSHLEGAVYVGVVRPALGTHDLMRLRGCLSDVRTNRATATVLGSGQAEPK